MSETAEPTGEAKSASAVAVAIGSAAEATAAVAGIEATVEQDVPEPAEPPPRPDKSPVAVPRRRKIKTDHENRRRRRRASATTSEDEGDSKTRKKPPKAEDPGPEDEEKLATWAKILHDAKTARDKQPWWKFWKWRPAPKKILDKPLPPKKPDVPVPARRAFIDLFRESKEVWRELSWDSRVEVDKIKTLRNKCIGELVLIVFICAMGAFTFRFTEATFESVYKCGVKRVKRDFVEELWRGSQYMKEDEWKSKARRRLMELEEQLSAAFDAGISSYSGHRTWTFVNALLYSFTVVTSIGYGHIAPATTTGKALTIVYALIGIPLFLILLADFGKLFTRCIKWVWAFVRRLYYTGSCKKVRKTAPVQEVMKGVQLVYDIAAFRRPSQIPGEEEPQRSPEEGTLPPTPAPSNFIIDDEFNLPISVAIIVLVIYIFCGAVVFYVWEEWTFFESFYFVFISMSTIGFGDFVPQNKMYMMASIVYLAFGLALTSMCINVVQEMLSDTFRQASAKIATTIGLKVDPSKEGTGGTVTPTHIEIAQVHAAPTPL